MWQLEQASASLSHNSLQCLLNLESPAAGLQEVIAHQAVIANDSYARLDLGLTTESITEAYQRGADLIATYAATQDRPATPQLYWRVQQVEHAVGIETIISLQTDQLDSRCPIRSSGSTSNRVLLQNDQRKWIPPEDGASATALLVEVAPGLSYLEIVHPTDLMASSIQLNDGQTHWQHTVLDLQLEKGVIRRARLQSWWIQYDNAQAIATDIIQQFVNSAPPLTT